MLHVHVSFRRRHQTFNLDKDIQLLSMMSVIVLQACRSALTSKLSPAYIVWCLLVSGPTNSAPGNYKSDGSLPVVVPKIFGPDYFNYGHVQGSLSITNHVHYPAASPIPPLPLLPNTSSRGSWSNLFNSSSMRQFVMGMQDSPKDSFRPSAEIISREISFSESRVIASTNPHSG